MGTVNTLPETPKPVTTGGPGWKTSEFWVSLGALGAIIAGQFTGHDTNVLATGVTGAVAAVYSVVRLFTKKIK